MDIKDKRILRELVSNSRQPTSKIAKKVGVSREVAAYRLKNLEKNTIKEFYTIINLEVTEFKRHTCFVQIGNASIEEEKEIIRELEKDETVMWLGTLTGKWNAVFDIVARNNVELNTSLNNIKNKLKKINELVVLSNVVQEYSYPEKIVGGKSKNVSSSKTDYKLNKIDKKILDLISNNSRIEYAELSKKLNLTANAIKHRIRNLEKNNVILGYSISFNYNSFGLEYHNIQIKTGFVDEVVAFCKEHENVFYHYNYLGSPLWDMDIGVLVKNSEELRNFLIELKEKFDLKINDTYLVNKEFKGNYPPKIVFK